MPIIFQNFRHLFLELFCAEPASKLRYTSCNHNYLHTNHRQVTRVTEKLSYIIRIMQIYYEDRSAYFSHRRMTIA